MQKSSVRRWLVLSLLVMAGEGIFFLPFGLIRIFRPTFLQVFNLTNYELGLIFSVYGTVAMGAYLVGGPLADRFPARKLVSIAILMTALGGFYMATVPDFSGLQLLFGFWGLTTILLFWAAMIKATREWGGSDAQGKAYGFLDGGRGLVGAGLLTLLVALFAIVMPENPDLATPAEQTQALRSVIFTVIGFIAVVSILVWFFLKPEQASSSAPQQFKWKQVGRVLRLPTIWLQSIIIVCAYIGYKVTDDISLYANEVMGYDEVESASFGTLSMWVRPIAAILAGIVADRMNMSRTIMICFGIMALGAFGLGAGLLEPGAGVLFTSLVITTSVGIFSLRSLYFAITQEGKVPLAYTGTVVGVISLIGYTPDIFMGPLMGNLLDANPGPLGHQYVFLLLGGTSLLGIATAAGFNLVKDRVQLQSASVN